MAAEKSVPSGQTVGMPARAQELHWALPAFEAEMHQRIHLENSTLFPRAIEMEEVNGASPARASDQSHNYL
jgi:hypothetical protein